MHVCCQWHLQRVSVAASENIKPPTPPPRTIATLYVPTSSLFALKTTSSRVPSPEYPVAPAEI